MYHIISSLCAGLIVLCICNIYFSTEVIRNHEYEEDDPWIKEKVRFAWGVLMMNIYMLIGATGWLLWDFDVISKIAQYKIGLLGRFFALAGDFLFFLTLSLGLRYKKKIAIVSAAVGATVLMYIIKVFV